MLAANSSWQPRLPCRMPGRGRHLCSYQHLCNYQHLSALLQGFDYGSRAQALLNKRPAQQVQSALSSAQVIQEYLASLQRSAEAEAQAGNSSSSAQAAAVCQEFDAFLQARHAVRGATLLTCSPVDVKVFFESQWLSQHGSLVLNDGQQYAAPSYLNTSISHLSGLFKRLRRTGEYDSARQVGMGPGSTSDAC